jgi:hypothetical protein
MRRTFEFDVLACLVSGPLSDGFWLSMCRSSRTISSRAACLAGRWTYRRGAVWWIQVRLERPADQRVELGVPPVEPEGGEGQAHHDLHQGVQAACARRAAQVGFRTSMRRTAVRSFVRAGVPQAVAMALSGHKTPSVFARYNIVSAGDLLDAAAKLDARTGTIQGQSAPQAPPAEAQSA